MTPAAERELHLRAMAGSAERRNRPLALAAVGLALFLAGVAYAGWAVSDARGANAELDSAARQAASVAGEVAKIRSIRDDPKRRLDSAMYRREDQILGKLEQIHARLGIAARPNLSEGQAKPLGLDQAIQQRRIRVTLSQMTLEDAMRWINAALAETQGLQVVGVEIKPDYTRGWIIEVDLGRWELKQ